MNTKQTPLVLDGHTYLAPLRTRLREVKGEPVRMSSAADLAKYERDIALQVIERRARGPEACRFLRAQVDCSAEELHAAFGVSRKTFYRWAKRGAMPMAAWLVFARIIQEGDDSDTLDMLLHPPAEAS